MQIIIICRFAAEETFINISILLFIIELQIINDF